MPPSTTSGSQTAPNHRLALIGGSWLDLVIIALASVALFATPLQMFRLATPLDESVRILISGAVWLFTALIVWHKAGPISHLTASLTQHFARISIISWILIGLALRLTWVILFQAQPGSDGGTYLALAIKLIESGQYKAGDTFAYWPVGYPAFLAFWISILPSAKAAFLISNAFVFIVGSIGVAKLGTHLGGPTAGRAAIALFALWPNLIFNSATPEKEMLVLALLPWATLWLFRVVENPGRLLFAFGCGILLGSATLAQPSLQLLPLLGAIALVIFLPSTRNSIKPALLVILGAAIIVSPWTIRNYQTFDKFVLVSTNGGDVLYRANNPMATGGYMKTGEIDLSDLSELEKDAVGRRLAVEWIRNHPTQFGRLAVEKLILFMGDDAVGVYNTLKVGRASDNTLVYALLKATANGWWMLAWLCMAAQALNNRRHAIRLHSMFSRTPVWIWLYLMSLHAVFESAGKYHVPITFALCVLLAVLACGRREAQHEP